MSDIPLLTAMTILLIDAGERIKTDHPDDPLVERCIEMLDRIAETCREELEELTCH